MNSTNFDQRVPSVLLIAPDFFGYDEEISVTIESKGFEVTRLYDRPFNSAFMKGLSKVSNSLVSRLVETRYKKVITNFPCDKFEKVLVMSGQTVSIAVLKTIRAKNKDAKLILYLWDSLEMRPWAKEKFDFYDEVVTFDHQNAVKYGLKFRPLFSSYKERETASKIIYDLCFIGTCHNDRYKIVNNVTAIIKNKKFFKFLYLQAPWVYFLYKLFNPCFKQARYADFNFNGMAKSAVDNVFDSSKVILDIEDPRQKGLTIRTYDALMARKKIITTNSEINKYKLFNPSNICVIDRNNIEIDCIFFETPFEDYSESTIHQFSCSQWVDDIFYGVSDDKFLV